MEFQKDHDPQAIRLDIRDFRAIIYLHFTQGKSAKKCSQILKKHFPDDSPSYATVKNWYVKFRSGRMNLGDGIRGGRPSTAVTPENIEAVSNMLATNPRTTYLDIEAHLGIGSGSVHTILHEHIHMRKLENGWIPKLLNDSLRFERLQWCNFMLTKFGFGMSPSVLNILIGTETWLYECISTGTIPVTGWVFTGHDLPVPFRRYPGGGKILLSTFYMRSGHVSTEAWSETKGDLTNWYLMFRLPRLCHALFDKRPTCGFRDVFFHHCNAKIHGAPAVINFLNEVGAQVVPYPLYSPDLAPFDIFQISDLCKKVFPSSDEAISAFNNSVSNINHISWALHFTTWFHRASMCAQSQGNSS